jgi:hypothetical protein
MSCTRISVLDAMIGDVGRAPEGPGVGAFFDVDGTLIAGYSAAAFYRHHARKLQIGPLELARTLGECLVEGFEEVLGLASA